VVFGGRDQEDNRAAFAVNSPMKVTFDSNVWEPLVVEPSEYPAIRERILSGVIAPYMTEISLSLESIQKSARQRFFETYMPSFTWSVKPAASAGIHGTFSVGPGYRESSGLTSTAVAEVAQGAGAWIQGHPHDQFWHRQEPRDTPGYVVNCGKLRCLLGLRGTP
jgi:hypothetical protein